MTTDGALEATGAGAGGAEEAAGAAGDAATGEEATGATASLAGVAAGADEGAAAAGAALSCLTYAGMAMLLTPPDDGACLSSRSRVALVPVMSTSIQVV